MDSKVIGLLTNRPNAHNKKVIFRDIAKMKKSHLFKFKENRKKIGVNVKTIAMDILYHEFLKHIRRI